MVFLDANYVEPSGFFADLRRGVRRLFVWLVLSTVIVGPFAFGGAAGWFLAQPGNQIVLERLGLVTPNTERSAPLITKEEIKAVGLSPQEVRAILGN